jgi:hypothetical protein
LAASHGERRHLLSGEREVDGFGRLERVDELRRSSDGDGGDRRISGNAVRMPSW